jgi:hypothetical protein
VIAAEGTPDELKRRISGDVVMLRVAGGENETGAARKLLADQAVVREVSAADGALKLTVERGMSRWASRWRPAWPSSSCGWARACSCRKTPSRGLR